MGQGFTWDVVHPSPAPFPQGKGRLFIARQGDFLCDYRKHSFGVSQHFIVPEADNAVAVRLDDAGPVRVREACRVLAAVKLDGEPQAPAGEVCDEVVDRKLTGEFRTAELARSQMRPEPLFGVGRLVAQFARDAGQSLLRQCGTPIPNPFPQGKGQSVAKLS